MELPRQTVLPFLPKTHRVLQLGRRRALTTVLSESLTSTFDFAVYGASQVEIMIKDMETHPSNVLLVTNHSSQIRLPLNYNNYYISANEAIEILLARAKSKSLPGIVTSSGGYLKSRLQEFNTPLVFERFLPRRFVAVLNLAAPASKRCGSVNCSGDQISFVQNFTNSCVYCGPRRRFSAVQRLRCFPLSLEPAFSEHRRVSLLERHGCANVSIERCGLLI